MATFNNDLKMEIGTFAEEWRKTVNATEDVAFTGKDASAGIAEAMAVKEPKEIEEIRVAARLSDRIMKKCFVDAMEQIVDEDTKVKHSEIAEDIEVVLANPG